MLNTTSLDPHFLQTHFQRGMSALHPWGVIQAQGEEAANFLHNQLTQDVLLLPVGQARLAAFCSAKGRMQASFVVLKTAPDTVLLVTSQDLLAQTLKRLSMFVMRAKVKLTDASSQWTLLGLLGTSVPAALQDAAPWSMVTDAGSHAVALYPAHIDDTTVARALWLSPAGHALPAAHAEPEPGIPLSWWQWTEVMSGVTLLSQPVFEAFVPQMLNYESVGGVNFKKGCYPGQEVVARSQFRGTLKRRTARVHSPVALFAGQEVFTPADPEQACGIVVLAAARPGPGTGDSSQTDSQGFDALVSGTLESMQTGWYLGAGTGTDIGTGRGTGDVAKLGAPLTFLPLPYPLLEDI
jgi:folate-binding protein YgfZ